MMTTTPQVQVVETETVLFSSVTHNLPKTGTFLLSCWFFIAPGEFHFSAKNNPHLEKMNRCRVFSEANEILTYYLKNMARTILKRS